MVYARVVSEGHDFDELLTLLAGWRISILWFLSCRAVALICGFADLQQMGVFC